MSVLESVISLIDLDTPQLTVHLVCRGIQQRLDSIQSPRRLKDVEGAQRIDLEVVLRIGDRRRNRHLTGKVQHELRVSVLAKRAVNGIRISYIRADEDQPAGVALQPGQVICGALSGQVVQNDYFLSLRNIVGGGVRSDETCTTCYQHLQISGSLSLAFSKGS